jgi:hypothetical protein
MTPEILGSSDEQKKRLIQSHLRCFVPLVIAETWLHGGPCPDVLKRAGELSDSFAEHGDAILYLEKSRTAKKKGFDTDSMYEKLVESVSILAFCLGGVTIFGCHFDAEEVRRGWAIPDPNSPAPGETGEGDGGSLPEGNAFQPQFDLARVLPVMRAIARLEVRWFWHSFAQLEALLPFAVLDEALGLLESGGPTDEMVASVLDSLPDLEQRGDDLFVIAKGESHRRFVQVAHALALLSLLPAGVTYFSMSFNARDMAMQGLAAFHNPARS